MRLPSRSLRFSLGMLLVVMTCLAGYFGGRKAGYSDGMLVASERKIYVETYDVSQLVTPVEQQAGSEPDFDTLIELIKTTVCSETWDQWHGMYLIQADRENLRLLITQTEGGHQDVAQLLAQLQKLAESYHDRVANNVCGQCGRGPLPAKGSKCPVCNSLRDAG